MKHHENALTIGSIFPAQNNVKLVKKFNDQLKELKCIINYILFSAKIQ